MHSLIVYTGGMEIENIHQAYRDSVLECDQVKRLLEETRVKLDTEYADKHAWKSKCKKSIAREIITNAHNMVLLKKVSEMQEQLNDAEVLKLLATPGAIDALHLT